MSSYVKVITLPCRESPNAVAAVALVRVHLCLAGYWAHRR
jgi:hypothetical protein